jgi:DNA-binding Lrp family transcriptional regulator
LDAISRRLLDRIQRSFPLSPAPYADLGESLEIPEREVLERLDALQREGLLRQISAIFNTGGIGFDSSLVAMAVPEEELEQAVEAVNRYPGVSHNYLRPGDYNVWFTIAVPPGESVERVVEEIAREAGGRPFLILPALKKYKLAVVLDVLEDNDGESPAVEPPVRTGGEPFDPSPENVRVVRCIQEDLPRVSRPFAAWAESLGTTEDRLLERIDDWLERGFIRRFAAVLDHRRMGFGANGMIVWNCPEDRVDEVGTALASRQEVTHCYHRPAHHDWPYNLYAMVHGRSREECRAIAADLAERVGLPDYRILFSTREFKKIRLKLFWDRGEET